MKNEEIQEVSLAYKEIYHQQTIYIYYLAKRNAFAWRVNNNEKPTKYEYDRSDERQTAIEKARNHINSLFNFEIPDTIEARIEHFNNVMYEETEDCALIISDYKAFENSLNKYAEWKNEKNT